VKPGRTSDNLLGWISSDANQSGFDPAISLDTPDVFAPSERRDASEQVLKPNDTLAEAIGIVVAEKRRVVMIASTCENKIVERLRILLYVGNTLLLNAERFGVGQHCRAGWLTLP
jgi:hypothetical protein